MVGGDFQKGEGNGDFQKGDSFEVIRKLLVEKKREQENKARERENKAIERSRNLEIVANELLDLGPLSLRKDEESAKKLGHEMEIYLDLDGQEILKSRARSINQKIILAIHQGLNTVDWNYGREIGFPSGQPLNQIYPKRKLEDEGFTIREVLEKCAEILCENGLLASAYSNVNQYDSSRYFQGIEIKINYD